MYFLRFLKHKLDILNEYSHMHIEIYFINHYEENMTYEMNQIL